MLTVANLPLPVIAFMPGLERSFEPEKSGSIFLDQRQLRVLEAHYEGVKELFSSMKEVDGIGRLVLTTSTQLFSLTEFSSFQTECEVVNPDGFSDGLYQLFQSSPTFLSIEDPKTGFPDSGVSRIQSEYKLQILNGEGELIEGVNVYGVIQAMVEVLRFSSLSFLYWTLPIGFTQTFRQVFERHVFNKGQGLLFAVVDLIFFGKEKGGRPLIVSRSPSLTYYPQVNNMKSIHSPRLPRGEEAEREGEALYPTSSNSPWLTAVYRQLEELIEGAWGVGGDLYKTVDPETLCGVVTIHTASAAGAIAFTERDFYGYPLPNNDVEVQKCTYAYPFGLNFT